MSTIREFLPNTIRDFFKRREVANEVRRLAHEVIVENGGGNSGGGWGTSGTIATLTGESTVEMGGNAIYFSNGSAFAVGADLGSDYYFNVNDGTHDLIITDLTNLRTYFQATSADGSSNSGVDLHAKNGDDVSAGIFSNNGATIVSILLDALSNSATYTADTHTFNIDDDFYIAHDGDNLFGVALDGSGSWLYSHFTPVASGLNEGAFSTVAVEGGVDFLIDASFNDAAKEARISGHSEATFTSLDYLADTHTFNGVINLPVQAAPASPNDGDIWRQDNTNTGLKVRINGATKTITVS